MHPTAFRRHPSSVTASALILVLGLAVGAGARAGTVSEVSIEGLLERSELVFEGRAISSEVRRVEGARGLFTFVTFEIDDVIKGTHSADTIELGYLGGTLDGETMYVTDVDVPELGERGVYFVESKTRRQVHPLYGWAQGHFRIVTDTLGVDRVLTANRRPVQALSRSAVLHTGRISSGTAAGVLSAADDAPSESLTSADFKDQLRQRLEELRR